MRGWGQWNKDSVDAALEIIEDMYGIEMPVGCTCARHVITELARRMVASISIDGKAERRKMMKVGH